MDLKRKPSAVRENKLFSLDMREIPISSPEADDNGAYVSNGSVKQYYTYNASGSSTAHRGENSTWYVKDGKWYKRQYVNQNEVYELTRMYKHSKYNPNFFRTIVSVRACEEKEPKPYFLVIYCWSKEGLGPDATRRTTSVYYRKDPQLLAEIDGFLEKGMSTDQVYSTTANRKEDTVSQTVWGPKMIDNQKLASKKTVVNNKQQDLRSEAEVLVSSLDVQQRSVCERQLVAQHAQWSQWILCGGKFSSSHRQNIWTPHIPTKRL